MPRAATGPRRIRGDRRGHGVRQTRRPGGVRVRLPGRVDRRGGRRADHCRGAAGDGRAAAGAGVAELRAAPACRRAPSRSCRWSRSRRPSSCTSGHTCPISVYLRHPTTGGVFASWGSLGHVTAAEPGALVGFLGPRVYEHLYGEPFPAGVQTAENLHRHGVIDGVVALEAAARDAGPRVESGRGRAGAAAAPSPRPSPCPTCPLGSRSRRRGARTAPASDICCGTAPPSGCCCRAPSAARRRR